jgi:hypothetical protein
MLRLKNLVVFTAIAAALAACGPSVETATTPSPGTTTSPTPTSLTKGQASPATATSTVSASDLGVQNISEIKFSPLAEGVEPANGYFDGVNNQLELEHTFPKTETLTLYGWAVISSDNKPASQVIITQGEQNTVVAIAPVNVNRADVATATNNTNYANSGWTAIVAPTALPPGQATLKAWAYDVNTKEAFQLAGIHTIKFQ